MKPADTAPALRDRSGRTCRRVLALGVGCLLLGGGTVDAEELRSHAEAREIVEPAASLPRALAPSPADAHAPSIEQLRVDLARERQWKEILGEGRWREIEATRFQLALVEQNPTRDLFDEPRVHEDVRDAIKNNMGKLGRDWLEMAIGLDRFERRRSERREERLEELRAQQRRRLHVSPRISGGRRGYLGTKIRLLDPDRGVVSRFALGARHYWELEETALRLSYGDERCDASLELRLDELQSESGEGGRGDVASFWFRISW